VLIITKNKKDSKLLIFHSFRTEPEYAQAVKILTDIYAECPCVKQNLKEH